MANRIYLIQDDDTLQSLEETPHADEALLQVMLQKYPALLAGDQIDPDSPRRWLLIDREIGVPDADDAGNRWSLDHLFLDQDGVPTLVEVKRSTDTRIRREVVGQMLDYAANAVVYWPVELIRSRFETRCDLNGENHYDALAALLGAVVDDEPAVDEFWSKVKLNLQAGRVRLVFVADEIPAELRRVVEFLNKQMDPAEVLAVELRQYVGQGIRTLVPQVLGQTVEAQQKKASGKRVTRRWDEPSFLTDMEARHGVEAKQVAERLLIWASERKLRLWWGKGRQDGSFCPMLDTPSGTHYFVYVWTYGRVEVPFQYICAGRPFDSDENKLELLERFNSVSGVNFSDDQLMGRPSVVIDVFTDQAVLRDFVAVLDWMHEQYMSV